MFLKMFAICIKSRAAQGTHKLPNNVYSIFLIKNHSQSTFIYALPFEFKSKNLLINLIYISNLTPSPFLSKQQVMIAREILTLNISSCIFSSHT